MTCEAARDRFSELLDGDLPEVIAREIREHLEACPPCQAEWKRFQGAVAAVRNLPQHPAAQGFASGIMSRLERSQVLAEPKAGPVPQRWSSPGFALKGLAAAAVLLLILKLGTGGMNTPPPAAPRAPRPSAPALADLGGEKQERRRNADPSLEFKKPEKDAKELEELDKNVGCMTLEDMKQQDSLKPDLLTEAKPSPQLAAPAAPPVQPASEPMTVALAWAFPVQDPARDAERIREVMAGFLPPPPPRDEAAAEKEQKDALNKADRKVEEEEEKAEKNKAMDALELERKAEVADKRSELPSFGAGAAKGAPAMRAQNATPTAPQVLSFRVRKADLREAAQRLSELGARVLVPPPAESGLLYTRTKEGSGKARDLEEKTDAARPEGYAQQHEEGRETAKPEEEWVTLTVTLEPAP